MEVTNLNKKSVVDVSNSFFLFEATGDSDMVIDDHSVSLHDDDAESFSWDSTDQCPSNNSSLDPKNDESLIDQEYSNDNDDPCDRNEEDEEEEEEEEDQNHRAFYDRLRNSRSEIGRPRKVQPKSSVSDDSTASKLEQLNEVEKNRLFWEACLAS